MLDLFKSLKTGFVLLAEVVHIEARTVPDRPGEPKEDIKGVEVLISEAEEANAVAYEEEDKMNRQEHSWSTDETFSVKELLCPRLGLIVFIHRIVISLFDFLG